MENLIHARVLEEANFIIDTGKTVREIANIFRVSKSTVHKDLHERLLKINIIKFLKYLNIILKLDIFEVENQLKINIKRYRNEMK